MPGKSNFGGYFYKPVDIKSGSGYANPAKGTLRADYGMQLYHYALLLQSAQGTFPPVGEILNRDRQRVAYPLDQFRSALSGGARRHPAARLRREVRRASAFR